MKHFYHYHHKIKQYWPAGLIAFTCIVVAIIISFIYLSQVRQANDDAIAQEITHLSEIFRKINTSCKITGFRDIITPINFLNVKSFEGSVVGSMNLVYPEKWQGPYLENNPTIEGISYQIIRTKKGYYILPGNGVKLANGKVIGKTIKIDQETDIKPLMRDPKALLSDNKPLAAKIKTVNSILNEI